MVIKHFYPEREKCGYCVDDAGKQCENTGKTCLRWKAYGPSLTAYALCMSLLFMFILKGKLILISILLNFVSFDFKKQKTI